MRRPNRSNGQALAGNSLCDRLIEENGIFRKILRVQFDLLNQESHADRLLFDLQKVGISGNIENLPNRLGHMCQL